MNSPVDFYFDFSSPYGYFASTRIEALAAEFDRTVAWHPILLGPIFKLVGAPPLIQMPMKGQYSLHDFTRTARLFDIPYVHPDRFPISTLSAARAMTWIDARHGPDKAVEFAHRVFDAFFARQQDVSNADVVMALGADVGIDPGQLADGIAQQTTKDELKSRIDAAIARNVFGSPFLFIDDEPFWGFDRFDYIRKWLGSRR